VTSRYHTPDETIEWLTGNARRMTREIDELRAELAARRRGCYCRWAPEPGLMLSPNPECPAHGVETTDLLTLGRAARDAGLRAGDDMTGHAFSAGPAPNVDPLRHVVVGDPDPTPDSPARLCSQPRSLADLGPVWCTRLPHPDRWQHIASGLERVLAVWTDDATVTDR